jgi:hypothetical protein
VSEERRPEEPEDRDDGPLDLEPVGDERREPPLVAFGIVAGTAAGGIVGLVAGAMLLGAGIGCAAGVIIGAVAQALHGRR